MPKLCAKNLVFTNKYKLVADLKLIADMAAEFTLVISEKDGPLVSLKTQKSQQKVETFKMISNQPNLVILDTIRDD